MKKSLVSIVAASLVLTGGLLLSPVEAAGDKGKKKEDVSVAFKKLDTNTDGKLSKEEFAKYEHGKKKDAKPKKADKLFSKLDTNNDASLSLDEFKKAAEHKSKK